MMRNLDGDANEFTALWRGCGMGEVHFGYWSLLVYGKGREDGATGFLVACGIYAVGRVA